MFLHPQLHHMTRGDRSPNLTIFCLSKHPFHPTNTNTSTAVLGITINKENTKQPWFLLSGIHTHINQDHKIVVCECQIPPPPTIELLKINIFLNYFYLSTEIVVCECLIFFQNDPFNILAASGSYLEHDNYHSYSSSGNLTQATITIDSDNAIEHKAH